MRVCVETISPIDMMCPPTSAVAPSLGESFHRSEVNCSCFQRGEEVNSLQSPVSSLYMSELRSPQYPSCPDSTTRTRAYDSTNTFS